MISISWLAAPWMAASPSWRCPRPPPVWRWPSKVTEVQWRTLPGRWAMTSSCRRHSMGLYGSGTRGMAGAFERSEIRNPASCSAAPFSPWTTTSRWWVPMETFCHFFIFSSTRVANRSIVGHFFILDLLKVKTWVWFNILNYTYAVYLIFYRPIISLQKPPDVL